MKSIKGDIYKAEIEEIKKRRKNADVNSQNLENNDGTPSSEDGVNGLALSGGGIRSASFSLGFVQSLIEQGKFKYLDYLSTVSGGGYTGSCISSVLQKDKDGEKELLPRNGEDESVIMRHLRNCSNYLLPQGLAAKLILPTTFLKGVLYNLLIAFPFIVFAVFFTEIAHELTVVYPFLNAKFLLLGAVPFLLFVGILPFFKALNRKKTNWHQRFRTDKTMAVLFLFGVASLCMAPVSLFIDDFVTQDVSEFLLIASLGQKHIIGIMLITGAALLVFLSRAGSGDFNNITGKAKIIALSLAGPLFIFCAYLILCLNIISSSNISETPVTSHIEKSLNSLNASYWLETLEEKHPSLKVTPTELNKELTDDYVFKGYNEEEYKKQMVKSFPYKYIRRKTADSYLTFKKYFDIKLGNLSSNGELSPAENKLIEESVQLTFKSMVGDILRSKRILTGKKDFKVTTFLDEKNLTNQNINILARVQLNDLQKWEYLFGRQEVFHIAWMKDSQMLWMPDLSIIPLPLINKMEELPEMDKILKDNRFQAEYIKWIGNAQWWFYLTGLLIFMLTHRIFNANWISQLSFYRDRLSFTFFVQKEKGAIKSTDDLLLSELNGEESAAPYHLVNVALNLQASRDPDLRGRNAVPFFFSKHYTGSDYSGFCKTKHLEESDDELTLATAMATSAAAASPNMGPQTVKSLVFILALLNIRLCYWLRNPRKVKEKMKRKVPGPTYILREAFSHINGHTEFVNLSDGGHIENLGLYQLLKRKCSHIVCVDGEADPNMEFNGLAIVMRYARIDMGINVKIDTSVIFPSENGNSQQSYQVAEIDYGNGEKGKLLYIKLSVTGKEQEDIGQYRKTNFPFPHQPTSDQFFDETQFEVYRALGYHIGNEMMEDAEVKLFWNEMTATKSANIISMKANFVDEVEKEKILSEKDS
ncbi:MAG: patatin-like phospholipase family protein [Lentisphaeraceae bacterium]|nr:patatin-like phospholipase family protein [Lentisphaeraceae bacterium]